jgi:hypothetical protein
VLRKLENVKTFNKNLTSVFAFACLLATAAYSQSTPNLSYQDQLKQYNNGKKDPAFVQALARTARREGDVTNAASISASYIATIRNTLTKENIEFLREFTISSKERGFRIFYRDAAKIDQIMGKTAYAEGFVEHIIVKEDIDPLLFPNDKPRAKDDSWKPDWNEITATITRKYNAIYADRIINRAKVWWYEAKEEWPREYFECLVVEVERYLERQPDLKDFMSTALNVNNPAWNIFQHRTDKAELDTAISWMARVLRQNNKDDLDRAFYMDTYANLLYKAGRKDEAVKWEQAALDIATATKQTSEEKIKSYESVVDKMKKSEPTWPTK